MPLFAGMLLMQSCKKDTPTPANPNVNFAATLTGASETPVNASAATATFTGTYNTNTKVLTYTLTYAGITPTAWHIHNGLPGVPGGVEFSLGAIVPSPLSSATAAFTTTEESDLMENKLYVNIHSTAFPNGEIRGQLNKQ